MIGFGHPGRHGGVSFGDGPLLVGPIDVVLARLQRSLGARSRDPRPGSASLDGLVDPEGIPEVTGQTLAERQQF